MTVDKKLIELRECCQVEISFSYVSREEKYITKIVLCVCILMKILNKVVFHYPFILLKIICKCFKYKKQKHVGPRW